MQIDYITDAVCATPPGERRPRRPSQDVGPWSEQEHCSPGCNGGFAADRIDGSKSPRGGCGSGCRGRIGQAAYLISRLGRRHRREGVTVQEGLWYGRLRPAFRAAKGAIGITLTHPPLVQDHLDSAARIAQYRRAQGDVVESTIRAHWDLDSTARIPIAGLIHPRGDRREGNRMHGHFQASMLAFSPGEGEAPGSYHALDLSLAGMIDMTGSIMLLEALRTAWRAALTALLASWGVESTLPERIEVMVTALPREAAAFGWAKREARGFPGWGHLPPQASQIRYYGAFAPSLWGKLRDLLPEEEEEEEVSALVVSLDYADREAHLDECLSASAEGIADALREEVPEGTPAEVGMYLRDMILEIASRESWSSYRPVTEPIRHLSLRTAVWIIHGGSCMCEVCRPLTTLAGQLARGGRVPPKPPPPLELPS